MGNISASSTSLKFSSWPVDNLADHVAPVSSCLAPDSIINGAKKWITGGMHASYWSVATKTEKGLTVFLVPRQEGVETRPIKVAYSGAAGTAYVTFKNVKVPAENMLGKENEGLRVIRECQRR